MNRQDVCPPKLCLQNMVFLHCDLEEINQYSVPGKSLEPLFSLRFIYFICFKRRVCVKERGGKGMGGEFEIHVFIHSLLKWLQQKSWGWCKPRPGILSSMWVSREGGRDLNRPSPPDFPRYISRMLDWKQSSQQLNQSSQHAVLPFLAPAQLSGPQHWSLRFLLLLEGHTSVRQEGLVAVALV